MGLSTPHPPFPNEPIALPEARRLRLGRALGRGSMATVYKGVLEGAHGVRRAVAVKVFAGMTPEVTIIVEPKG